MAVLFLLLFLISKVHSARILAVFPYPSLSHQLVFRTLTNELAKRGHQLVILTPNPGLSENQYTDNVREINTNASYNVLKHTSDNFKGIVVTAEQIDSQRYETMINVLNTTFNTAEMKTLLADPNENFNLIIAESLFLYPLVLARKYKAPLIWFSSFYESTFNYEAMGAPSRHPLLYGNYHRKRFYDQSLKEKIYEFFQEFKFWYTFYNGAKRENELVKEHFGVNAPSVFDAMNDIDLLFVNANPVFEGNRPVPPNVIHLGGLHLKPSEELSEGWKALLDSSEAPIVYVSLETIVRPENMDKGLINLFLEAFERMPYNILWKFEGKTLRPISNLRTAPFFPQRDLLFHPKVKAFITQGGLQSTDEAIDAGVPLIGIPMMGDQWMNSEKYVKFGIGLKLDILNLSADDLVKAVDKVVNDERYQESISKLGALMRDQPQSSLERAVWWTEYVLRHGGAKHLRSPLANVSWSEYLLLDVVLVLLIILCLTFLLVWYVFKLISDSLKKGIVRRKKHKLA